MRTSNPSILIVWSSLIQVASGYLFGPSQVTGSLGGSARVSCYFSSISANIHGRKFWCKVHKGQCYTVVSTTPYIKGNYMNRTHLQEFRNYFMINMTSLQPEDSGAYWCGIGNSNHGLHYPVNVTVSQGKKVPSFSEILIGRLRGSLVIPCPALPMPHNGTLYWCKVSNTNPAACDPIIDSSGQINRHFWGRVLIQEERNATGFNVLVNDLRMGDSGFYRCGVYAPAEELDWKDVHVHIINELSTVQSLSTTTNGGAPTISPIQDYSHSVPPSNVSMQDTSAVQYSTSSSSGQRSTEFSPMSSNPAWGTDSSTQGMNPSRSSGTQTTHESGAPSTLGPQRVSGTTQWTVNSTLYSQPVSGKNESRTESLVSRRKNLYLILIPVLVIACISILATVFAVHVKGQKNKAANGPTTDPEHIAMIDGEAKPENAQHNDSNVFRLADPEDLSGETDV